MDAVFTLGGFGLTAIALVISILSFTRRMRAAELHAAEERGKMLQRMTEVEKDVDQVGEKIRNTESSVNQLQQDMAGVKVGIEHIQSTLNTILLRFNQHFDQH